MPAAKPKVELICSVCGRPYLVQPYRATISKCCSRHCAQRYAWRFTAHIHDAKRGTGTKSKYVKQNQRHQHRVVAEQQLGRPLIKGEVVHHRDSNGKNNHPDNLQVTNQPRHIKIHWPEMMAKRREKHGF